MERIISLTVETLRLKEQLESARSSLQKVEQRLEQLQKQAPRQAAPFRRPENQRSPHPGRPGRKAAHPGSFRPKPEHIDEQVHVPLPSCPHCGTPHAHPEAT